MRPIKRYLITLVFIAVSWPLSGQVLTFRFNEASGTSTALEEISTTDFPIVNNFDRPERIAGVEGNALRLDGWSTWASNSFTLSGVNDQMSIAVWHATEAFTAEYAALVSQDDGANGFSLEVGSFGNIRLVFTADGTRYSFETSQRLNVYQWNFITATIDLPTQTAKIFVNGVQWLTEVIATHSALTFSSTTFYVGRSSTEIRVAGFLVTALNGAIDNLNLYNHVLSQEEVTTAYDQYNNIVPDLTINKNVRHADDWLRPRYHSMPNTSWTNEPYGLIYHQDKYHLFFQKNPNGPYLYFMHWGHMSSPDLVNWKEEKIAMRPDPGFDDFGVWSGTTVKDQNGVPVIYYTGVNGFKAGIGMATANDDSLIHWNKSANNPLIPNPPAGYNHMDFRDPYLWKDGSTYYMIVGSGISNDGGGILFTYRSTDIVNWTAIVPMYRDMNVARSGRFWEMPSFMQMNDSTWMLQVTPLYNGQRARTIYWLGKWTNERFYPYSETPKNFELITENLLAPAISVDADNTPIYIGIIPEERSDVDQIKAGWRHVFSLPREIRVLKDSSIAHIPHRNLCRLRKDEIIISDQVVTPGSSFNLPGFGGNQTELKFQLKADSASRFSIQLFKHADGTEYTSLFFDLEKQFIALDKRFSTFSDAAKTYRKSDYTFHPDDTINVHVFTDHSVLEVFVDQLLVFSTRVYPSRIESHHADLVVTAGSVKIITLTQWQLNDMDQVNGGEVCIETDLPDHLHEKEGAMLEIPVAVERECKGEMTIYPVPADNKIRFDWCKNIAGNVQLDIYALDGRIVKSFSGVNADSSLSVLDLLPGIYVGKLSGKNFQKTLKIMISR